MGFFRHTVRRRLVALLVIVGVSGASTGCATMAHDSSFGSAHARTVSHGGDDEVCPWVLGDVGLLFLGVIPGVIGLIVDFGTGAWRHADAVDTGDAKPLAFIRMSTDRHASETPSTAAVASQTPPTP